jgi:plastocyanin
MYVVGAVCAATGLIVAGLLATIQAVEITSQGALDFDAPSSLTVLAKRTLFAPSMFDVPVGTPMEIRVVNEDALYHTFTYREGSALMSRDILPLSTSRFIVTVDDAGPLEFWCVPHEGTMRGTMTGV